MSEIRRITAADLREIVNRPRRTAMVKQFTEPTDRINVSLPRDMLAAMRLIQRNEGVPLSRQVRMAMTEWIMDRAAAKVREDSNV